MGLGGCYSVPKYLLIIFNFIFTLVGLAFVTLAVWMLVNPTFYVSVVQEANDYLISNYILLVAGILLVVVGFLGCGGSFKESKCLLITFFSLLLVIIVAEIAAGLWAYMNASTLETQIRNSVKQTVDKEYWRNDHRKLLFDTFQSRLHCCGAERPTEWIGSSRDMKIAAGNENPTTYDIPDSCCREGVPFDACKKSTKDVKLGSLLDYSIIYDKGCYNEIVKAVKDHANIILGVEIFVLILQFLGLIFASILCFGINRSGRYKA